METINTDYNCKLEKFRLNCSRCANCGIAPLTMFVFLFNRLDAAMERERLQALEKEKAKEEAKKREQENLAEDLKQQMEELKMREEEVWCIFFTRVQNVGQVHVLML